MNIQKIRKCFYQGKVLTKTDHAIQTHLSLASITNILQELLKNEDIFFIGENDSTGGRKSKRYVLNKDKYHILKILLKREIDGYRFGCHNVDLFNQIIFERNFFSLTVMKEELISLLKEILSEDQNIAVMSLSIPGVFHDGYIDVRDFKQL